MSFPLPNSRLASVTYRWSGEVVEGSDVSQGEINP